MKFFYLFYSLIMTCLLLTGCTKNHYTVAGFEDYEKSELVRNEKKFDIENKNKIFYISGMVENVNMKQHRITISSEDYKHSWVFDLDSIEDEDKYNRVRQLSDNYDRLGENDFVQQFPQQQDDKKEDENIIKLKEEIRLLKLKARKQIEATIQTKYKGQIDGALVFENSKLIRLEE